MRGATTYILVGVTFFATLCTCDVEPISEAKFTVDTSWFEKVKESIRENPETLAEIFKNHFQEENSKFLENKVKTVIQEAAVLDHSAGNLKDQYFGSLVAKFSGLFSPAEVTTFSLENHLDTVISDIVTVIESVEEDLNSNQFTVLSLSEKNEQEKTQNLLNKIKTKFQTFKGNLDVDAKVINSFMLSKLSELKNLKEQSKKAGLGYRSSLKFWISQTLSVLSSIETFKTPDDVSLELKENSDLVSYSIDDEDFIGEVIGEMLIAKIEKHMDENNFDAASKAIVDVLLDLTAYFAILSNSIALCFWLIAFAVGPITCFIGFTIASISTVLLVLRALRHLF